MSSLIEQIREHYAICSCISADELVSFNILGSYVGQGTPIFLRSVRSLIDET